MDTVKVGVDSRPEEEGLYGDGNTNPNALIQPSVGVQASSGVRDSIIARLLSIEVE